LPEYCLEEAQNSHHDSFSLPTEGLHLPSFINELEKNMVSDALARVGNNQTRAAEILQIPVYAFRHLLTKHHLNNHNFEHTNNGHLG
jgi:DNA-binding NtrC family response regulator